MDGNKGDSERTVAIASQNTEKHGENGSVADLLAGYSESEKANAVRKLDWVLIPLYENPLLSYLH